MQYKTAQNLATITSIVDGAPKRNELGGYRAWFPAILFGARSWSVHHHSQVEALDLGSCSLLPCSLCGAKNSVGFTLLCQTPRPLCPKLAHRLFESQQRGFWYRAQPQRRDRVEAVSGRHYRALLITKAYLCVT